MVVSWSLTDRGCRIGYAVESIEGLAVNQVSRIEITVDEATAIALSDERRREAVGRLIDRLVRPGVDDPLAALFERISGEAVEAGLSDAEVDAELAAYNAERRA